MTKFHHLDDVFGKTIAIPQLRKNKLPGQKGLFGSKLSNNAMAYLNEPPREEVTVKKNIREFVEYHMYYGWPYDYFADSDYIDILYTHKVIERKTTNLIYLNILKGYKLKLVPDFIFENLINSPSLAPPPNSNEATAYVWPSYIVWENDPSHISFLGSLNEMELPRDVLRTTTGHPEFRNEPRLNYKPGIYPPWTP